MRYIAIPPAAAAGPAVLVLGQPALTGFNKVLDKVLPNSVRPWTSAACKGASYGLGAASMLAWVSPVSLLPAAAIGTAAGATLAVAGKLLAYFYTRTAAGRRLAGFVEKVIPLKVRTFFGKAVGFIKRAFKFVVGDGRRMSGVATVATLRQPLFAAMNVVHPAIKYFTTVALGIAAENINRLGTGEKSRMMPDTDTGKALRLTGNVMVAGAAAAAPVVLASTISGTVMVRSTRISVGVGTGLMVAAFVVTLASFSALLLKVAREAMVVEVDPEPDPDPNGGGKPNVINLVDPQGNVHQVEVPIAPMMDAQYTASLTSEQLARISRGLSAAADEVFEGPVNMSADLYSKALDRLVADGMTHEQAVEALKPKRKPRGRRAKRTA